MLNIVKKLKVPSVLLTTYHLGYPHIDGVAKVLGEEIDVQICSNRRGSAISFPSIIVALHNYLYNMQDNSLTICHNIVKIIQ